MGYETFSVVLNIGGITLFLAKYLLDLIMFVVLFIIVKFVQITQPILMTKTRINIREIKYKE
jgi:hypothetical protein